MRVFREDGAPPVFEQGHDHCWDGHLALRKVKQISGWLNEPLGSQVLAGWTWCLRDIRGRRDRDDLHHTACFRACFRPSLLHFRVLAVLYLADRFLLINIYLPHRILPSNWHIIKYTCGHLRTIIKPMRLHMAEELSEQRISALLLVIMPRRLVVIFATIRIVIPLCTRSFVPIDFENKLWHTLVVNHFLWATTLFFFLFIDTWSQRAIFSMRVFNARVAWGVLGDEWRLVWKLSLRGTLPYFVGCTCYSRFEDLTLKTSILILNLL